MSDENAKNTKKGMAVKIIIPILLVCVIAGIWVVKNNKKDTAAAGGDNADFSLHSASKILRILMGTLNDNCILYVLSRLLSRYFERRILYANKNNRFYWWWENHKNFFESI